MRLLLVEDDYLIGRGVNQALRDQGYAVDWVRDAMVAVSNRANHHRLYVSRETRAP